MILIGAGALAGTPGAAANGDGAVADPAVAGAPQTSTSPRRGPVLTGAKVAGRYALLGFLAYVMIARLRLPPLGLLAGASSIVAAVAVEAVRLLMKKSTYLICRPMNGEARTSALDRGCGQRRCSGPLVTGGRSSALGFHFTAAHERHSADYLVMVMLIVVGLTVLSLIVRSRLSVENPGTLQIVLEDGVTARSSACSRSGSARTGAGSCRSSRRSASSSCAANYMGLVPGLMAPTSSINVTLGCAITTWVYYHFQGIKDAGHRQLREALLGAARRAAGGSAS